LRLFPFGGCGLALAALALVVFGSYYSYPTQQHPLTAPKNTLATIFPAAFVRPISGFVQLE